MVTRVYISSEENRRERVLGELDAYLQAHCSPDGKLPDSRSERVLELFRDAIEAGNDADGLNRVLRKY